MPPPGSSQLLALYQQIDGLIPLGWRAPRCRRWRAETQECLRRTLGFHPVVVQFQGLRFRAGPVTAGLEELTDIPDARHDERFRADMDEARRLLRGALLAQGVDPDSAPARPEPPPPVPAPAPAAERPAASTAGGRPPGGTGRAPVPPAHGSPMEVAAVAIRLRVRDAAAARVWYQRVLGRAPEPGPGPVAFKVAGCRIELCEEGAAGDAATGLRLGVMGLDAERERLAGLGIAPASLEGGAEGGRFCALVDPDGRSVVLHEVPRRQ